MTTAKGKRNLIDIAAGKPPGESTTVAISAAAAAVTQVAVTDSLNGATFTGTALLTSATPTVDELEAIAGMLGLALNAAGTDIAAQKVELDKLIVEYALLRAVLVDHGFIAA